LSIDVGELAVVADGEVGQLWPAVVGPGSQPLPQRGLGRLRGCGHVSMMLELVPGVSLPTPTGGGRQTVYADIEL